MTTTATRSTSEELDRPASRRSTATSTVSDAVQTVRTAADDAAHRLPGMAESGRAAFDDANRRIAAGSDEMIWLGTAVSLGFAVGLLVGGANRILVGAAFVPVCMFGFRLLERSSARGGSSTTSRPAGGL